MTSHVVTCVYLYDSFYAVNWITIGIVTYHVVTCVYLYDSFYAVWIAIGIMTSHVVTVSIACSML